MVHTYAPESGRNAAIKREKETQEIDSRLSGEQEKVLLELVSETVRLLPLTCCQVSVEPG
jgi:hypothetical protein